MDICRNTYAGKKPEDLEIKEDAHVNVQPVEELLTVELVLGDVEKVAKIGSKMKDDVREEIIKCLWKNKDIFVWTPQDLEGIDPGVITHHLNIDPNIKPVKQKKRTSIQRTQNISSKAPLIGKVALSRFISKSTEKSLPFFKILRKARNFEWNEECQRSFEELKIYLARLPSLVKLSPGDTLYLYLSSTYQAIRSVLIQEEEGTQAPIYYVSKVINGGGKSLSPIGRWPWP
ncbi:UNVERIFIED_CONTAM: hypothetical protein Slati_2507000 [Sesamum latifolium]|uniref:Reverse transcriptase/retrotransposon-derived protein RNase H-like domain-containing protein n=1 Tax=Sesamum latifolium TaxID=2727402 RepID=A0AAW2WFZ2_9LAMI